MTVGLSLGEVPPVRQVRASRRQRTIHRIVVDGDDAFRMTGSSLGPNAVSCCALDFDRFIVGMSIAAVLAALGEARRGEARGGEATVRCGVTSPGLLRPPCGFVRGVDRCPPG